MTSGITRLLSALEGVVNMQNKKWHAICPNHTDHNPSLIVTERYDGKVLIYCEVGCSADSVLKAAGLRWNDVQPDRWDAAYVRAMHAGKRRQESFGEIIDIDKHVMRIAASRIRSKHHLSVEDEARIEVARRRLSVLDKAGLPFDSQS